MRPSFVLLLATVGLLGCAPTRYQYAPVSTSGAEVAGAPAASFRVPPGSDRGDARVAMLGIVSIRPAEPAAAGAVRAAHVVVALSNRSDLTWTVDVAEQRLELAVHGERSTVAALNAELVRPAPIDVPPRASRWLDLYFPLPAGLQQASELPAFDVLCAIHVGGGVVASRATFERFMVAPQTPDLTPESPFSPSEPLPGSDPSRRGPAPAPMP